MASHTAYKAVLNALYFSGAGAASRSWLGGLGGILMLHRVAEACGQLNGSDRFSPNAYLTVSPRFLDRLLGRLKRQGFEFVSMDELLERLKAGPSEGANRRMLAVTLDDGYRDNLENAVPVFRSHSVPYTIYVAPGLVDGRAKLWWEDLEAIIARRDRFVLKSPKGNVDFDVSSTAKKDRAFSELMAFLGYSVSEDEQRVIVAELAWQAGVDQEAHRAASIMNWREIVELSRDPLCTIGAHTLGHYALARLDEDRARAEIEESGRIVGMETGETPRHFAYPYGSAAAAGPREFRLVREAGYATAVTTRHGILHPRHADHPHALPRISVNGAFQSKRYVETLLSGIPTRMMNKGRALNVS